MLLLRLLLPKGLNSCMPELEVTTGGSTDISHSNNVFASPYQMDLYEMSHTLSSSIQRVGQRAATADMLHFFVTQASAEVAAAIVHAQAKKQDSSSGRRDLCEGGREAYLCTPDILDFPILNSTREVNEEEEENVCAMLTIT